MAGAVLAHPGAAHGVPSVSYCRDRGRYRPSLDLGRLTTCPTPTTFHDAAHKDRQERHARGGDGGFQDSVAGL